MATNGQLTGMRGVYLVAAELSRLVSPYCTVELGLSGQPSFHRYPASDGDRPGRQAGSLLIRMRILREA